MKLRKYLAGLALVGGAIAVSACGSEAPPAESGAKPAPPAVAAPAAKPAASGKPRVFFVEPQEGATVKSPVRLRFGIEGYEIGAVPANVEKARPGVGHHHVAVDSDCLPPGSVIPKAAPWVHFGDGKNEIDMQLPPGPHKLTLQLGDDAHTTIEGLCASINVTVAP
jgi:hypothetical protein